MLRVHNIRRTIGDRDIISSVSFSQAAGEKIAIAGETGSGKSTLLKIIAGLIQPDGGEVLFNDSRVEGPSEKLVAGHAEIAYLSQDFVLPKSLTVGQVLEYSNKLEPVDASKVFQVARIVHLLSHRTDALSGGEKQRVAIARMLVGSPMLLLLDEPYSNLDASHKHILKKVVDDISEDLGITCLMVSHDPEDTLSWADTVIVMRDGQIVQQGSPHEVYQYPVSSYVAALTGAFNLLDVKTLALFDDIVTDRKDIVRMVRTEDIRITRRTGRSVQGKVKRIRYYGSYYEADVSIGRRILYVRTLNPRLKSGDEVFLTLQRGAGSWVKE